MAGQRNEIPISTLEAWGLSMGKRVWVGGNNVEARLEIELVLPADIERPPTGPINLAFVAPQTTDEAVYFARKLRPRLDLQALLWIVFPKFGTPHEREFSGSFDDVVIALFELGYAEAARAPVGDDYTSLGFRLTGTLI